MIVVNHMRPGVKDTADRGNRAECAVPETERSSVSLEC